MLGLSLKKNSFQFSRKDYLQIHGTALGTKMAVAIANIFMAKIERQILRQSSKNPLVWKRYIDDVFSLWDTAQKKLKNSLERQIAFTQQSNLRLKYQKQRLHSWTRKCTRVRHFTRNLSLTCKHIQRKHLRKSPKTLNHA